MELRRLKVLQPGLIANAAGCSVPSKSVSLKCPFSSLVVLAPLQAFQDSAKPPTSTLKMSLSLSHMGTLPDNLDLGIQTLKMSTNKRAASDRPLVEESPRRKRIRCLQELQKLEYKLATAHTPAPDSTCNPESTNPQRHEQTSPSEEEMLVDMDDTVSLSLSSPDVSEPDKPIHGNSSEPMGVSETTPATTVSADNDLSKRSQANEASHERNKYAMTPCCVVNG